MCSSWLSRWWLTPGRCPGVDQKRVPYSVFWNSGRKRA